MDTPQERSLAKLFPELASEWHPALNGNIAPSDVSYGTEKRAWWLCSTCSTEWETKICSRTTHKSGCPACSRRLHGPKIECLSREQQDQVVEIYKAGGVSTRAAAKQFEVTPPVIQNLLKRRGVTINRDRTQLCRTYKVNHRYFETIDTEEKAYFLGLLYADGNVSSKKDVITLQLQWRDKPVLDKFKKALSSEHKITFVKRKTKNRQDHARFSVHDVTMAKDLIALGCIPRKSLKLDFPTYEQVPKDLMRHMIRGYVDGDGCVYVRKGKTFGMAVSIMSNDLFCLGVQQFLKNEFGIESRLTQPRLNKSTRSLTVDSQKSAFKLMEWLYHEATVYLDRKHQKWQLAQQLWKNRTTRYRHDGRIKQIDTHSGEVIAIWNNGADAAEALCGDRLRNQGIMNACAGELAVSLGYRWEYEFPPEGCTPHTIALPSSGYRGVRQQGNRWLARIVKRTGKYSVETVLGHFDTAEDAALAYNTEALKRYGKRATLNNVPNISIDTNTTMPHNSQT